MALSNMRAEPRREITESVIGISVLVGGVVGDYFLAKWEMGWMFPKGDWDVGNLLLGMIINAGVLFAGSIILTALAYFTHWVGEEISGALAKSGWDPRPKQRYAIKKEYVDGKWISTRVEVP